MHSKEALRSIVISQRLLGTREIAVFHHTGCGMLTFDTAGLRARVKADDPGNAALGAVDGIDFLEFAGLEESVRADVQFLRENPLVLPETKVTGRVYEVETGNSRGHRYPNPIVSNSTLPSTRGQVAEFDPSYA